MIQEIFTIGGYGNSPAAFFDKLQTHGVDVLVDIRQRRGLRGKTYSFLNSTALQAELASRGIGYLYLKDLAPTTAVREAQKGADSALGVAKRERTRLSDAFVSRYNGDILEGSDPQSLAVDISPYTKPCFFCVEGPHTACHRALVTTWLAKHLTVSVTHL